MSSATIPGRAARRAGLMALCAAGAIFAGPAGAATVPYTFLVLDNPADANFNQLLSVNDRDELAGYDGDGTVQPNKGYLLVPTDHYADENFPNSAQTQVTGINNFRLPATVGFWVDANGNNFGFTNWKGHFQSVSFPNTPASGGVKVNQLLGINDGSVAAGFYLDAKGNSHGYVYAMGSKSFQALSLGFPGVTSFQATGINNTNVICGSFTDATTTHGFYGTQGSFTKVDIAGASATTFLGINNKGYAVGFITKGGVSHGLIYNTNTKTSQILDEPLQSSTAAFGVTGTTINGLNDANEVVGFYSDGTKVHGFLAWPS